MLRSNYHYCLVLLLLLFVLKENLGEARDLESHNLELNSHIEVKPILHHGRTKREISSTRDTNGVHHSEVQVTVPVDGEKLVLDLQLNIDLIAAGHTLQYQLGGNVVQYIPTKEELDYCNYLGRVRGKPQSWVAVSTCHGLHGVIFDGEKMRYIEPAQATEIQSPHRLYYDTGFNSEFRCGYHEGVTNFTEYNEPLYSHRSTNQSKINKARKSRNKRATEIRVPSNADSHSSYIELVLVADHREFQENGNSLETVHKTMIQLTNFLFSMYAPLNIYIALVGVVVWNERDEIQLDEDGNKTLGNFIKYRKENLTIPNDNAQLVTRQHFIKRAVGWGGGKVCNTGAGVSTRHGNILTLAQIMAHEMGHNLRLKHDEEYEGEDCSCNDRFCIMKKVKSNQKITGVPWSQCSVKYIKQFINSNDGRCLRNTPKKLFGSSFCGNGFIEPGEQCDCGVTVEGLVNERCHVCCNPDTCMLRSNATCGDGACCDLNTCRLKPAGEMCRSDDVECDLPEYCNGHSEFCPADVYKMDSTPCGTGDNQAYCMQGACKTHSDQCRLLWGPTAISSHPTCYTALNIKGDKFGNCGYDTVNKKHKPCAPRDALCGKVHCGNPKNQTVNYYAVDTITYLVHKIKVNDKFYDCYAVLLESKGGSKADDSHVPDGAKCGEAHMCLNQKCVSVETVRKEIAATTASSECPSDCSGHGVCNSKGSCHCEKGRGPPQCSVPGPGGSVDSGPISELKEHRIFMIVMYSVFLGIIPFVTLVLLVHYFRHEILIRWRRPKNFNVDLFVCCANNYSKPTNIGNTFLCNTSKLKDTNKLKNERSKEVQHCNLSIDNKSKASFIALKQTISNPVLVVKPEPKQIPSVKKIKKEDIQIVSHNVYLKPVVIDHTNSMPKTQLCVSKPTVAPKPKTQLCVSKPLAAPKPKTLKSEFVIEKQELAANTSTGNVLSKVRLLNVRNENRNM